MSYVKLEDIGKRYKDSDTYSVSNVNIDIQKGEFIAFIGPSGCGKSTTLRMVAGLEDITSGNLKIDNEIVNDMHPKDRNIAMVFQSYALYPHMTVFQNIAFSLEMAKIPMEEIKIKVDWAANILGLTNELDKKPKALSGGQRQRVALGRAIVREPKLFLMDEPLSNLDAKLRVEMRNEIMELHRRLKVTTIYVTHDQVEAMTMADRIVVLYGGVVQQIGTPMELYNSPKNKFVAGFIGMPKMNFFNVVKKGEYLIFSNGKNLKLSKSISSNLDNYENKELVVGIRPEHINLATTLVEQTIFSGNVRIVENMGSDTYLYTKIAEEPVTIRVQSEGEFAIGKEVNFLFNEEKLYFFDKDNEISIL